MKVKDGALIGSVSISTVEFIEREVRRHFQEWVRQFPGSLFTLRCKGDNLVFTTNSMELADKWYQIEKSYVESMLNPDMVYLETTQEYLVEDWFLLPAA